MSKQPVEWARHLREIERIDEQTRVANLPAVGAAHEPPQLPLDSPASEDWSALKQTVARFETAWRQGLRRAIDDFLPATDPLRFRTLIEVVAGKMAVESL